MIKGLFVWLSPYRLLNVIFDRKPDLFAAYVRITRVSIIARRLLAPEAWKSLGPIRVQTLSGRLRHFRNAPGATMKSILAPECPLSGDQPRSGPGANRAETVTLPDVS